MKTQRMGIVGSWFVLVLAGCAATPAAGPGPGPMQVRVHRAPVHAAAVSHADDDAHQDRAALLIDQRRFAQAAHELMKSYRLTGSAESLLQAARCYESARDVPAAVRLYRRWLAENPGGEGRADVVRKVAALAR